MPAVDSWPERIPDGIEPITGYRYWSYTLGDGLARLDSLRSVGCWEGAGLSWIVSSCLVAGADPGHVAPVEGCTCGFYALSELTEALFPRTLVLAAKQSNTSDIDPDGVVWGRVELAGKIIEHECGYRAERARIVELIPIQGTERTVMLLASRLGLSVGHPVAGAKSRPRRPPDGTSSIRLRVKEWIRLAAASLPIWREAVCRGTSGRCSSASRARIRRPILRRYAGSTNIA